MKISEMVRAVREVGLVHLRAPLTRAAFDDLLGQAGASVGRETIALRAGAHAYVARPGPVPLHTDHPAVDWVAWWCEAQDEDDGSSWLLDTAPIVASLEAPLRAHLHEVALVCPRLEGGPPTEHEPVLRTSDGRTKVFCSPWLTSVEPAHQADLNVLRARISEAARSSVRSVRLQPGEALIVDNGRILHGRGAIGGNSRRRLHRTWIRRPPS